jgi:hypothetical protein
MTHVQRGELVNVDGGNKVGKLKDASFSPIHQLESQDPAFQSPSTGEAVIISAINDGCVPRLEQALRQECTFDPFVLCLEAIANHQLCSLQCLHQHGIEMTPEIAKEAILAQDLGILAYVMENGCVFDRELCSVAAGLGWMEGLQFLASIGHS